MVSPLASQPAPTASVRLEHAPTVSLALIGCGQVGSALLELLRDWAGIPIQLIGVANSRVMQVSPQGIPPRRAQAALAKATRLSDVDALAVELYERGSGLPVIVDATASVAVALRHESWLKAGLNVITANKIAASAGLCGADFEAYYGDAATVGAGLPVLHTLRRLRAAGDRIHRIEGVLSGSLAYLCHALQSGDAFSRALTSARDQGYTEPDPRTDLSGHDVARKLAVIAHAAGLGHVALPEPECLLPEWMLHLSEPAFWRALPQLDTLWRHKMTQAASRGRVLRYIAAIGADDDAHIGLRWVESRGLFGAASGADNLVAIYSAAYHRDPLVIRGPGAGPLVTARALVADIAELADRHRERNFFHAEARRRGGRMSIGN